MALDARLNELQKLLEQGLATYPELARRKLADALALYRPKRCAFFDDLKAYAAEETENLAESATRWRDRCNVMRASAQEAFGGGLTEVVMETKTWIDWINLITGIRAAEDCFYVGLANVSVPTARDYLVSTRVGVRAYTAVLDTKWRALVDEGNKLQEDERKIFAEIRDICEKCITDVAKLERTTVEGLAEAGKGVTSAFQQLGGLGSSLLKLSPFWSLLVGIAKDVVAPQIQLRLDSYLASNGRLVEREAAYRSLLLAETGGLLPIFRETRKQVAEYWERNSPDATRNHLSKAKDSLATWTATCAPGGCAEDAKQLSDDLTKCVEKHLQALQTCASDFESKWSGVFRGALAASTCEELLNTSAMQTEMETLLALRMPEALEKSLVTMDQTFEQQVAAPLRELKSKLDSMNEAELAHVAEENLRIAEDMIRARVRKLHEFVRSLNWFQPDKIRKLADRNEIKSQLG